VLTQFPTELVAWVKLIALPSLALWLPVYLKM
jgi:hypothetical protein